MKRFMLLVSALAVLLVATVAFSTQRSSRDKDSQKVEWEYLVIVGGRQNLSSSGNNKMAKLSLDSSFREHFPLEMNLDKLGAEGWELITVTMTRDEPIYYLKRLKDAAR
ncbi:MAG TPA: hypothetical protein VFZ34_28705 [Blastocatellia bacterium]|nr:hypothetical protein [Blastocatellia bacterium]